MSNWSRNMQRCRDDGLVRDLTYVFAQLTLLGVKQQEAPNRPDRVPTRRERQSMRLRLRRKLRRELQASLELIENDKYAGGHAPPSEEGR